MAWTDERIEQLKRLWEGGMTASAIADELGGVSRNAVIGKAHRLGLQPRPSPVRASDAVVSEVVPEVEAPVTQPDPPFDLDPEPEAEAEEERVAVAAPAPVPVALAAPQPVMRSIGPGGFTRQAPGEQSAPATPAPPRRLVPAKPSTDIKGKTSLLELNDKICKWPIGHPGEPDFHFCGQQVNPGFPYCLSHCSVAYQAQLPRRDRRPAPALPYGGPRAR